MAILRSMLRQFASTKPTLPKREEKAQTATTKTHENATIFLLYASTSSLDMVCEVREGEQGRSENVG